MKLGMSGATDKEEVELVKQAVISRLDEWVKRSDKSSVEIEIYVGIDTIGTFDIPGSVEHKYNGTETILIHRNGGAKDGDLKMEMSESMKQSIGL